MRSYNLTLDHICLCEEAFRGDVSLIKVDSQKLTVSSSSCRAISYPHSQYKNLKIKKSDISMSFSVQISESGADGCGPF